MNSFINSIGATIGRIISSALNNHIIYKIFNSVYENSPHFLVKSFVKYIELPDKDNIWIISLINKKKIVTNIYKDRPLTSQFALSYKWHSPEINFTELILNQYFDKEIPWIDIGANLGLRSLLALSKKRKVFFIEPNKELNKLNEERCKQNNFDNYFFFECGASDTVGEVDFFIDKTSYNSSIEPNVEADNIDRIEKIKTDTVDNLFKNHIHKFSTALIKIDVEGHELNVLKGSREFIKRLSPTIIIEVNQKGSHFAEFKRIMRENEYTIYEIIHPDSKKYFKKLDIDFPFEDNRIKFNDFLVIKDKGLQSFIADYVIC
jgi:FkbM family methyltransferase